MENKSTKEQPQEIVGGDVSRYVCKKNKTWYRSKRSGIQCAAALFLLREIMKHGKKKTIKSKRPGHITKRITTKQATVISNNVIKNQKQNKPREFTAPFFSLFSLIFSSSSPKRSHHVPPKDTDVIITIIDRQNAPRTSKPCLVGRHGVRVVGRCVCLSFETHPSQSPLPPFHPPHTQTNWARCRVFVSKVWQYLTVELSGNMQRPPSLKCV
ncbi:hypothetical protein B0T17DRAFT_360916 [Bombardia bombarda]|uniref:Uncharacterized protein n=1 Tax=Bombardia bombarda TaxID=252184 RepID=A0AA39WIB6_9PEZI|nr:hypothetical protein B0T17DRAFT_360916 [Bombardia bombarda]